MEEAIEIIASKLKIYLPLQIINNFNFFKNVRVIIHDIVHIL